MYLTEEKYYQNLVYTSPKSQAIQTSRVVTEDGKITLLIPLEESIYPLEFKIKILA